MKTSFCRWLTLVATSGVSALLLTSSCGRQPIQTIDDTNTDTVTVTGAFADWTPATSSFAGGVFLLLDSSTNEVFKSDEIKVDKTNFKIENVPVSGKYYGVLLDGSFEPKAYLQKTASDGKIQRIFKLGNSGGQLGTIVVRDGKLESSQHSDLDFQTLGSYKELKKFESEYSTNFTANPDIDSDGVPNVLDTDVDGDGETLSNSLDALTYNGKVDVFDSTIPWQYNYGYGIPKQGYFKCDHLRTPKSKDPAILSANLKFQCNLKLSPAPVEKVELSSTTFFKDAAKLWDGATAYDWLMHDDASAGDLFSGDGIWTSQFSLDESVNASKNQMIIASVTLKTGTKKAYITSLEPTLKLKPASDQSSKPIAKFTDKTKLDVNFQLENLAGPVKGFQISATIFEDSNDKEIKTLSQTLTDGTTASFTIDNTLLNLTENAADKYRVKIRIQAPSALPGLLGSAFELYSGTLTYPAP
ncbi:hypothetical protein EBU99_05090 [bacterium]|nr:hypothetical protein [bacterium]